MTVAVSTISQVLGLYAREVLECNRTSELRVRMVTLDGMVSILVNSVKHIEPDEYLRLLLAFGEHVLGGVLGLESTRLKLSKLNCDGLLADCYCQWRSSVEPSALSHILTHSAGWRSMENLIRRRGQSAVGGETFFEEFYDFHSVAERTPAENVHVSYFRYLMSKGRFGDKIIQLVNEHNRMKSAAVNDSNATMLGDRRGSRDSVLSISPGDNGVLHAPMAIFSSLCLGFINSFCGGVLLQLSNQLSNAIAEPPSKFLKSMLALAPSEASAEAHASIQKHFYQTLMTALRGLSRGQPEVVGLAFLMRAEMSVINPPVEEFPVMRALLSCAVRFATTEIEIRMKQQRFGRFLPNRISSRDLDRKALAWLAVVGGGFSCISRKEIKAIYREIAADSSSAWETVLGEKLNACTRLLTADLALLRTTAFGLGIAPIPLTGDPPVSVLMSPKTAESSPVSVEDVLRDIRAELGLLQQNNETLFAEISMIKQSLLLRGGEDEVMKKSVATNSRDFLENDDLMEEQSVCVGS